MLAQFNNLFHVLQMSKELKCYDKQSRTENTTLDL
jgi:hypothetical protein